MTHTPTKKSIHPLLAPALLIVLFAAASFAAILMMEQTKIPTLPNDTAWMESYLTRYQPSELSEQQKEIIQSSAAITSAVAEDAGVKITLRSVCGNGYTTYYKLDVELPQGMNEQQRCSFGDFQLELNDASAGLSNRGSSFEGLEDDNPSDHHYSCLLTTQLGSYGRNYAFDNGIVRTLHLENIQIASENGQQSTLIEGQWDFGILFRDEGKVVALIQDPVLVSGFDYCAFPSGDEKVNFYEAQIKSLTLTEFSLYCSYELKPNLETSILAISPLIIMKDGRTVQMGSGGGSSQNYSWNFRVPISLDEVAFVKLTDEVFLPIS